MNPLNRKQLLYTLAFVFTALAVPAQKVYKRGVVVPPNGDTLKGWIDYGNWRVNPKQISFKTDSAATATIQYGAFANKMVRSSLMNAYSIKSVHLPLPRLKVSF